MSERRIICFGCHESHLVGQLIRATKEPTMDPTGVTTGNFLNNLSFPLNLCLLQVLSTTRPSNSWPEFPAFTEKGGILFHVAPNHNECPLLHQ